jgi:hypothetical protein
VHALYPDDGEDTGVIFAFPKIVKITAQAVVF